ncbi:WhiB family transcriptional regulator [Streptomyces sp. NPDC020298]|uniref:WhiB family transcriptional regulator n=1 Tax=unclassified Streptomyces TaxID=2593676 RepID=UPI0033F5FA90
MSRTNQPPAVLTADTRIPFPHTQTRLACRKDPGLFVHDYGQTTSPDDIARIQQASAACRRCPIAEGCLKWALANPKMTTSGIWAATTARQRTALRRRLRERLGDNWVDRVVQADQARTPRRQPQPLRGRAA